MLTMNRPIEILISLLRGMYRGLAIGLAVCFALGLWLSLPRLLMLAYYWPTPGDDLWAELLDALLMGGRFDMKVAASSVLLLFPLLGYSRTTQATVKVWATLFAILAVVNFYYYGFYKIPIDSVIFGLFDDDTLGVLQTIWQDFPIGQIAIVLCLAIITAIWASRRAAVYMAHLVDVTPAKAWHLAWIPVLLVVIVMLGNGMYKGMPLQTTNTTATSKVFLNHAVPNGVSALYYAWNSYKSSVDIGNAEQGVKAYGFASPVDAAKVLGLNAATQDELQSLLLANGPNQQNGKNLVFLQMESWSAEPFKYQSKDLDVLAGLNSKLGTAWLFNNFDSASGGTHPALEAIILNTPISPITIGKYRDVVFNWGLPSVFKKAGYDTLFVTSGLSGWRELNRSMRIQGFDEVIDAASLTAKYPGAGSGLWGVWDAYMFKYIQERLEAQPKDRPLFVYAMSTTNHPPYEIPDDYKQFPFDINKWPGDKSSEKLIPNLQSYRYVNDELAKFVSAVEAGKSGAKTMIAATGDHNVRTFGQYVSPESQVMRQQVPFVVWGANQAICPQALHQAASHLDMFPTLFPLLGIHQGYLLTGRDLSKCPSAKDKGDGLAVTFVGQARTEHAMWNVGNEKTMTCQPLGSVCDWRLDLDEKVRARLALMDWNVRYRVQQTIEKK